MLAITAEDLVDAGVDEETWTATTATARAELEKAIQLQESTLQRMAALRTQVLAAVPIVADISAKKRRTSTGVQVTQEPATLPEERAQQVPKPADEEPESPAAVSEAKQRKDEIMRVAEAAANLRAKPAEPGRVGAGSRAAPGAGGANGAKQEG